MHETEQRSLVVLPFRSKAQLVTDYLRAELQLGRPAPGERLVVSKVAEQLGVSKVPVREAVTQLIGEGLLELRPNVGPVVPSFTPQEVIETALMRSALDCAALESAMPLHDKRSLAELAAILLQMETADEDFTALNVDFHIGMLQPSPYRELVRTCRSLLERAQRYGTVHRLPGYRERANGEHLAILEALRAGELDELKRLHVLHVRTAAELLVEHLGALAPAAGPKPDDRRASSSAATWRPLVARVVAGIVDRWAPCREDEPVAAEMSR